MKKLSQKQKIYWEKYAKRSFDNKVRRSLHHRSYEERSDVIAQQKKRVLNAPEIMDLKEHYNETVLFFNQLRALCVDTINPFRVNFTPIKSISPAAALVFTAEIDRIMKTRAGKKAILSVRDFNRWDRNVKLQLRDMGMFDLLNTQKIPKSFNKEENQMEERFLKFQSGALALGADVQKLKGLISALTFLPQEQQLQAGLTEAMTNSIQHAYPEDYLETSMVKEKLWWMSASVNLKTRFLTVMFYDEGVGIPKTLPKTWPEALKSFIGLIGDGDIIKVATQVSRTSTKQANRGKGLKDIKNYIDLVNKEDAELEIYSLKGYYKYTKTQEETAEHENLLEGTLIQWKVPV